MSLSGEYFDRLYAGSEDPWSFRSRWYEERKRALTLAALPRARYGSVFEPGCSIGVLTAGLAGRAERVLAMDVSAAALERAAAGLPGPAAGAVDFVQGAVPDDWPPGRWDLVVLSEVGYYLDLDACRDLTRRAFATGDEVVAVHWRHEVADYPLDGDMVHRLCGEAAAAAGATLVASHVEEDFRLDVWSADGRSVARREEVPGANRAG